MEKEDQIIGMLGQILNKLDEHTRILGEHSKKLDIHSSQLDEHGTILGALRSGQDHLKAEIDDMKISNAKEFGAGALEEKNNIISINLKLLHEEIWANRVDIDRIKNTMGMN